jgi:hypothetical protein
MEVSDGRDKVLRAHTTAQCRAASDSDAEMTCVSGQLAESGRAAVASQYYRLENWCLERLVACTAKLADDVKGNARKLATDARHERVESSASGLAARAQVTFAEEKIAYLRAILPVQADGACVDASAVAECQTQAHALDAEFASELDKDDAAYDESKALQMYQASHAKEASCRDSEFACLTTKLDNYGGNVETHRYMAQTLKSLEQRQRLVIEAGSEASAACLDAGIQQYQSRIVEDYQHFSRDPGLFFQAQLHRDFRVLYDAQVGCLQSARHPHRATSGGAAVSMR